MKTYSKQEIANMTDEQFDLVLKDMFKEFSDELDEDYRNSPNYVSNEEYMRRLQDTIRKSDEVADAIKLGNLRLLHYERVGRMLLVAAALIVAAAAATVISSLNLPQISFIQIFQNTFACNGLSLPLLLMLVATAAVTYGFRQDNPFTYGINRGNTLS